MVMTAAALTGWHRLRVSGVEPLDADTVAVSLDVPDPLAGVFAHRPGQHVTVRHIPSPGGAEIRRSYSVCLPPGARTGLRLVVRRLGKGGFAEYATTVLAEGDMLELAPPAGDFRLSELPGAHHVLVAGGSGITPLLSMAAAALRDDPECRVSLVYANRTSGSVLLADELADLKDAHMDRFSVLHLLSQEAREAELLSGRVDGGRLPKLLALLGAEPATATCCFYLCGPHGLVDAVREGLAEWGAEPGRVRFELFSIGPEAREPPPPAGPVPVGGAGPGRVTARLAGRTSVAVMEPGDRVVLDAVLRARPETPYSCRDGLCGVCRAKVTRGSLVMDRQYALGEAELSAGYTLPCRARPETDEVGLDFDA
jgi:ring-1,2-phenylacetyl-CoA epoxidase subunit PaaE